MLDQCPDDIACWSQGGESFTIKNIDAFESEILPRYFKHSKFASFNRQLNFYGFNKQRSDPDLQIHTRAVRFSHEFFRRGRPDLLNKIQRTTASKQAEHPSPEEVGAMQEQIQLLQHKLAELESQIDERVEEATKAVEQTWATRVKDLEQSYGAVVAALVAQYKQDLSTASYLTRMSPTFQPTSSLVDLADYIRKAQTGNLI